MAWYNRKMLVIGKDKLAICLNCSPERCPSECGMVKLLAPPSNPVKSENHRMPYYFVILLCVLGAIFVFICYMITLRKYKLNPRRNDEDFGGDNDDFIDENPDMDHPIWYIHTIGLPQSVIESIPEFKYKKIDSLIDGVDCSVCLTEFEEDESLRLLPKCSHAFHVPCIDTWLSSHMTCPVCRAPIVSDLNAALGINNVEVSSTDVNGSSANEVNPVENGRTGNDLENQEVDEGGNREMSVRDENLVALQNEEGKIVGIVERVHGVVDERGKGKGLRVSSDLAEHRVKINNVMQTALRSVSMDPSAVLVVHRAMSQMNLGNGGEGCSNSNDQVAEGKIENSDAAAKRGNRNSSLYEAMKCSSFGRSLQKVPIYMKRSFSTSGKCSVATSDKEVKNTSDGQCKLKDVMQPALRSASMDPSAISVIHRAISEMTLEDDEECSNSNDQLAEGKTENSDAATKRGNRNSSLYEAMKCSSFGRSLQKVPVYMKRSFSSSGKCSASTSDKELKNPSGQSM